MRTIDIEIALMRWFSITAYSIIPNISFGMAYNHKSLHECDLLLLSKSGYATEIEIKISKGDIDNERKKKHNHQHPLIKRLYFAVPYTLVDYVMQSNYVPKDSGVISVEEIGYVYGKKKYKVRIVKEAIVRKGCVKWDNKLRMNFYRLGVLRILGFKEKISINT